MAFHRYQVNFDENGEVETVTQLPEEPAPRKRSIIVREETPNAARHTAEELYSLAE